MSEKEKAVGYDKYIDWKVFVNPLVPLFSLLLMHPTTGMHDAR